MSASDYGVCSVPYQGNSYYTVRPLEDPQLMQQTGPVMVLIV
jgi:hypothetical protein